MLTWNDKCPCCGMSMEDGCDCAHQLCEKCFDEQMKQLAVRNKLVEEDWPENWG